MKKKYFYMGKAYLSGGVLGHCFCLVEDFEKLLCFKGSELYYTIGKVYEMDVSKETGKIKTGQKCENKDGYEIDEKVIIKWKVKSSANIAKYQFDKANKRASIESANIENMTLKEIKEHAQNSRNFKKIVLFYLWGGGIF